MLARLVFTVGTPALLVRTLAGADVPELLSGALLVTVSAAAAAVLLSLAVARLRRRTVEQAVIGALSASYVNAVNLGLPIAVFVLGDGTVVAPALLFQLAVLAPVAIGVLDARSHAGAGRSRLAVLTAPLRNPLLLATAAGLLLGALRVPLPTPVGAVLDLLGGTAVPCALLAFGISLAAGARPRWADGDLWTAVVLKLAVSPAVAWLVGTAVLGLTGRALLAVVLVAGLPTAQNVFVFASRYDSEVTAARDAVLVSTLLSVVSLTVLVLLLG